MCPSTVISSLFDAEAGGPVIPGSSMKTTVPMIATIRTGMTVQMTSSRVFPCTWSPSTVRGLLRARYLMMKTTSEISTIRKIAVVKPSTTQYAVLVLWTFGECGCSGEKPPSVAAATPADASATAATTSSATNDLLRTRSGILFRMPERSQVDLPSYVPDEFDVYVGGVRQTRGVDYEQIGRSLFFPRAIAQEGRLGFWRWTSMWLGIAGTYRKHETVDIVYELNGRREVATGLVPQPVDD